MSRTALFYGTRMAPPILHRAALLEGLTDGNIWRLDIFKSDECERIGVKVRAQKSKGRASDAEHRDVQGDEVSAQTYAWITREHRFECREWDFDHFVKEEISRGVGREVADKDATDAVAALDDPTSGRGVNGDISRQFESGGQAEEKVPGGAV
ncbi:unnamed protein product [Alternaria alternata]